MTTNTTHQYINGNFEDNKVGCDMCDHEFANPQKEWCSFCGQPFVHDVEEKIDVKTASRETTKLFKFKEEQTLDESMISTDNLEHKSSGFIAQRLIATLEKRGNLEQVVSNRYNRRYEFINHAGFDIRKVAMLGVQLAGLLVHIDKPMDLEAIANSTFAYKRFNRIALMNKTLFGDEVPKDKAFWVERVKKALNLCVEADLLTRDEDGLIVRSKRYISSCISRSGVAHQLEPITLENRRKERVKTRFNPRRDGTAPKVRSALDFIESHAQVVNTELLDVIQAFINEMNQLEIELPEDIKDSLHVIKGCQELRGASALYSEYFMDLRGRLYQFAHAGPNPQASDLARALCYHTEENIVRLEDEELVTIFMNELRDEVADDAYCMQPDVLTWVAQNPLDAIKLYAQGGLKAKKFWTYMVMANDWHQLNTVGQMDCRIGFGPDAKCSGAQIFAILAGCEDLGASCGLTTASQRPADPYVRSAGEIKKLAGNTYGELFRKDVKTPFMAIQYGGGVPSLRYKKFEPVLERIGVEEPNRDKFCQDVVIQGIMNALGPKVNSLIQGLRDFAAAKCKELGKDYFDYKHIDGFKVTKRGDAEVQLTDNWFIINFNDSGKGVIFGSTEESKNGEQGWVIPSNKTGPLQRKNFIHYFPVHFIQGIDAVVARAIANAADARGLKGYTSIHDQFRSCLRDAPAMMDAVRDAYRYTFMENNPLTYLEEQMKMEIVFDNPLTDKKSIVTEEILMSPNAFFFE